jgi:hypothetical protein
MEIESTAIGGEMMTLHGVLWVKIEAVEEKQGHSVLLFLAIAHIQNKRCSPLKIH